MLLKIMKMNDNAMPLTNAYNNAACIDIPVTHLKYVRKGIAFFGTDWKMECPDGYHIELYVRSSTPHKFGWTLANNVGIIDNDYRGEIVGLLQLTTFEAYNVYNIYHDKATELSNKHGISYEESMDELIASWIRDTMSFPLTMLQFRLVKDTIPVLYIVNELSDTTRSSNGLGSSS